MISEEVFETVSKMLPEGEGIPVKFDLLYTAVKHRSDCIQDGRPLTHEMLALLLVLSRDNAPIKANIPEPEVKPEPVLTGDQELDNHLNQLKFRMGNKVKVFRDKAMVNGTIAGIPFGHNKKYRVKIEGDEKPTSFDEKDIALSE